MPYRLPKTTYDKTVSRYGDVHACQDPLGFYWLFAIDGDVWKWKVTGPYSCWFPCENLDGSPDDELLAD